MKGVYLILSSSFLFSVMGLLAKFRGKEVSSWDNVFYRSFFAVVVLTPLFIYDKFIAKKISEKGGKKFFLISRGLSGTFSLFLFFYLIQNHSLGLAVISVQTSPIYLTLFEILKKSEKPDLKTILSIVVGFIGILFTFQISAEHFFDFGIAGILCGISTAYSYNSLREMRGIYNPRTIVLSFCILGSAVPFVLKFFQLGSWYSKLGSPSISLPRSETDFVLILSIGLFAMLGQIFLTKGYVYLPASEASALGYSYVVFALVLEFFFGNHVPNKFQILGTILIVLSGIIIAIKRRNTKKILSEN
ncbi:MAG: DMT family transporter [Leptospiraceae bacterium]|nr:DMT family transporter [Leptospiraceae bacterium]